MKKKIATLLSIIIMTFSMSIPVCAAEDEYNSYDYDSIERSTDPYETIETDVYCNVQGGWSVRIPKTIYLTQKSDGTVYGEYTVSVKGNISSSDYIYVSPSAPLMQCGSNSIWTEVTQEINKFKIGNVSPTSYTEGHNGVITSGSEFGSWNSKGLVSSYETFRGTDTGYLITEKGTITSDDIFGVGDWHGTMTFKVGIG